MKKQSSLPAAGRKLSLNKKTISNLQPSEMNNKVGGGTWTGCYSKPNQCGGGGNTKNGNTCYGHNTCYTC